ncbi:MAG: hypothetical protein A2583_06570 [Bdellovibrionales bacterium RIFOXYD1_FULL_53_11]|nr:MAG: hypothetical protein A2583_06570 [Bdellovibrionales bacterium RIFOXYD1_FULL_53_11]
MIEYLPVALLFVFAATIGGVILVLSRIYGPKIPGAGKDSAFECGMIPHGDARGRLPARYYLVAVLFLVFDVEAVFLFPWALVLKKYLSINAFILFEIGVFAVLAVGAYLYVLLKGALEWD